jgi:hypothetical protein
MPQLMCARKPADQVDYENERFVVCKATGVNAYGVRYELGDELPRGVLQPRALREIYDTPLRLIETMDYALADEDLLAAMMARPSAAMPDDEEDEDDKDTDGDVKALDPQEAADARTPGPLAKAGKTLRTRVRRK